MSDLDSIRCFVAAAELLNFRKAAESVSISAAAFGQRIQRLEDTLGAQLFERTTRSITLTPAGLRALPKARKILAGYEELGSSAHEERIPPVELTIGTRYELGLSWVYPSLLQLSRSQPEFQFHLRFGGAGADLVDLVLARGIDAAITSTRLADSRLEDLPLHPEHYVLVAAADFQEAKRLRQLSDLARLPLLDADRSLPLFRYFKEMNPEVSSIKFARIRFLGTIAAILEGVRQKEGVAVLPQYFVQADLEARRLRRIFPKLACHSDAFRLVFRADDPRRSYFHVMQSHLASIALR